MRWTVLLALVLVAGCFGSGKPDYAGIDEEIRTGTADVLVQEHDGGSHFDAAVHNASHNMRLIGYHNAVDASGDASHIAATTTFEELALWEDYAFMTRVSTDGSEGGFVIIDIHDPTAPRLVSTWNGQGAGDIEISEAGDLAFVATQRSSIEQVAGGLAATQSPVDSLPRGIHIVDISEKEFPTGLSFYPMPYNGPHTLTYVHHKDGNEYIIACTYDFYSRTIPSDSVPPLGMPGLNPVTQRVQVLQLIRPVVDGVPPLLVQVAHYQITDQAPTGMLFFPHDTSIVEHPDAGTLLYVSYWDKGLRILDFNDPRASPVLEEIGHATDFSPSQYNAIHQSRAFPQPIADMHVTVTEPEIISAPDETGQITFLDTTDPTDPRTLGHWTLPGDLGVQSLEFSPHYFDFLGGRIVLAHYHAGIWVIDVSDADNLAEPKTVGYAMPAMPRPDSPLPQPMVWSVFEHRGDLVAVDMASGLYIYEYTGP